MNDRQNLAHPILTPDQRVRVFISSTLMELAGERATVRRAVKGLRLHPIMFEAAARPHPPQGLYRSYLEQSHIYVGIFWRSYGWVGPGMTVSGIEDEFNRSADKPRLVYVKEAPEGRDTGLERLLERMRNEGTLCYRSFSTNDELYELIQDDIMLLLSERFGLEVPTASRVTAAPSPPDFLQSLRSQIEHPGVVSREHVIGAIEGVLAAHPVVAVTGAPGAGKTYVVGVLGTRRNAIYLSLRRRTLQYACAHLVDHLAVRRGRAPRALPSEEEARAALQEELANGATTLIIDDVDQNPAVAKALLALEPFDCRLVFVARGVPADLFGDIPTAEVPQFDFAEVEQFLILNNITLPPGELERVYVASAGNPLYLSYFAQSQVRPMPLPTGLDAYQRTLWDALSPVQKEIANLLAHSLIAPTVADMHEMLNTGRRVTALPMETKGLIDAMTPLVRRMEGHYDFFHPTFGEFVRVIAAEDRLQAHYHRILGEHALAKGQVVATAYHLMHGDDPRMAEYLVPGARVAIVQGAWPIAEQLLQRALDIARVPERTGTDRDDAGLHGTDAAARAHILYLLAQVYRETGRAVAARDSLNAAIGLFGQAGDEVWVELATLYRDSLLVEEGQATETVERLRRALERHGGCGDEIEAGLYLNLSYAYIRLSLFREGADTARRALELFRALDVEHGIYTSLVNLANCVGSLGENDLQEQYAQEIIGAATQDNLPRLKAAGLNLLAVVRRRQGRPEEAQRALEECIRIAQSIGSIELEALNIANLGNAFHDRGLDEQAERAYMEALTKAREHHLARQEGHALELLAKLRKDNGRCEEAIALGVGALELHRRYGEHHRIATIQDTLGHCYAALDREREAAESYEDAGEHHVAAGLWDEAAYSYGQAAGLWTKIGRREHAARCAVRGAECALRIGEAERAEGLLRDVPRGTDEEDTLVTEAYLRALRLFVAQPQPGSFAMFMLNFTAACKRHPSLAMRRCFDEGLRILADAPTSAPPARVTVALALGVEQAGPSLLPQGPDALAERVDMAVDHLHHRALPDGLRVWTLGLPWRRPLIMQINCMSDDAIAQRVAMALALILHAGADLIGRTIDDMGGNQEDTFALQVVMAKDGQILYGPGFPTWVRANDDCPATTPEIDVPRDEPRLPTLLILDDDYEGVADWAEHPGSKALIWVLMLVHRALVMHCTGLGCESRDLARKGREFCEALLA